MKITVLVDNTTLINKNYFGEHGASFLIEEEGTRILLDTGYSDIFLRNAYKMGINLRDLDYVVLSHGHLDHTWGLSHLMGHMDYFSTGDRGKKAALLTHPLALCPKMDEGEQIGMIYSEEALKGCFHLRLSKEPVWITEKLVYLGQIERKNQFENKRPLGVTVADGVEKEDYLLDDSSLAYRTEQGLVIITGCAHAGICNTIEYAKKVCGEERILAVIGGMHLLNPPESQLQGTLEYLEKLQPGAVYACHCTDLYSKIALSRVVPLKEVGVGVEMIF